MRDGDGVADRIDLCYQAAQREGNEVDLLALLVPAGAEQERDAQGA